MMDRGATFSDDRVYRYRLWRIWNPGRPRMTFVMLNPSTADENVDDPTVKRCIDFAMRWGWGSLDVLNIFALRATDPHELMKVSKPTAIGPDNDWHLSHVEGECVAAWGNWGALFDRGDEVRRMLRAARCFGLTGRGEPRHPLYLRNDSELQDLPEKE